MSTSRPPGPPYASPVAGLGGRPTPVPDGIICSILIALFAGSAAGHMSVYQLNHRRKHFFLPSLALFGFSMARILTSALRIGVAYHPSRVALQVAAQIFLHAGIVIVYVVNLVFAQRIIRARQPAVGWHAVSGACFRALYGLVGVALALAVGCIVVQFSTLDPALRRACRHVQLAAGACFLLVAVLPLVALAASWAVPESPAPEPFGIDRGRPDPWTTKHKSVIVLLSASLCALSVGFKTGAQFEPPRPAHHPAWYHSKAALYLLIFAVEIFVVYLFLATRVDRRFWVPNGSSTRKSFARGAEEEGGGGGGGRRSIGVV